MQRENNPNMGSSHKQLLAQAIVGILRPMIRILIRNEFVHSELTELIRKTYVEVAYNNYSIPGQEMSISRVAVLTGLSRKEVVRLRNMQDDDEPLPKQEPNRAQRVVHGWLSDKEFLDKKKQPKELPIKGSKGSFMSLVRRYSGDITYGAVLDELNLVGVTSQLNDNTVQLVNRAYIPHKDELRSFQIMSSCVSELFKTAVHNIETNHRDKYFQRQVIYNGIDEKLAEKFKELSSSKAAELIEEMNHFLSDGREQYRERQKSAGKRRAKGKRVGLGIYYLQDAPESLAESKQDDKQKESVATGK